MPFLEPIWEVWNWTNGEWTMWGVLLLLYSAFASGYGVGKDLEMRDLPVWAQLGFVAFMAGVLMVLIANDPAGPLDSYEPY